MTTTEEETALDPKTCEHFRVRPGFVLNIPVRNPQTGRLSGKFALWAQQGDYVLVNTPELREILATQYHKVECLEGAPRGEEVTLNELSTPIVIAQLETARLKRLSDGGAADVAPVEGAELGDSAELVRMRAENTQLTAAVNAAAERVDKLQDDADEREAYIAELEGALTDHGVEFGEGADEPDEPGEDEPPMAPAPTSAKSAAKKKAASKKAPNKKPT